MKPLSLLSLIMLLVFALAGCKSVSQTMQPMQSETIQTVATSFLTLAITDTEPSTPTRMVSLPSDTPSPSQVVTPFNTLEPAQARETLQPLLKEPMNCAVPCFLGIIPGKTSFDEARNFFSQMGFTPFEGTNPTSGVYFYTISYDSGTGHDSSVTLHIKNNLVEDIRVTPDIPTPKEGSPREWIAFSPETLIKRYGSPSRVVFSVGSGPNIGIDMIMYFDTSDLIVYYSGYNMTPKSFCPLTAPFDHVNLWIGHNPPDTPSFETVPLEKATSLTMDQFTELIMGDPKKACFSVKGEVSP